MLPLQISVGLLWTAWLLYLAAGLASALGGDRISARLFAAGFVAALIAVICRGATVGRLPMQGMYEFFAAMGVLIYPIALLSARVTERKPGLIDPLLGAGLLFLPLFVLNPAPRPLPPGLRHWLFGPHVMAYLTGYLIMFKAGYLAFTAFRTGGVRRSQELYERDILALTGLGFPLLTAGLVFGAFWGRLAWGGCWNWDPKEMLALATWLVYAAALYPPAGMRSPAPRRTAVLSLLGCALILCTLILPNFSRIFAGLHSCGV